MAKNSLILIFILIFLVLPVHILAQSGEAPTSDPTLSPTEFPKSLPSETPINPISAPAEAITIPRVTFLPVTSPIISSLPVPSPTPIPTSQMSLANTSQPNNSNLILGTFIAIIGSILAVLGWLIYKGKVQKKNDKDNRCSNIKELLEQKKKELEESTRNWPEEKVKALAEEKMLWGLKKNEDVKKIIETAESLKAKHDKLKKTIELLQKRYDLCILELPPLSKEKNLKFKGFKAEWIMDGSKTATMRLFDDKDLKKDDNLNLINSDDGKLFAKATVTEVIARKLGEVEIIDLDGHEKWNNREEMLESFKKYYGNDISLDTTAKIIRFKIIK